MALGDIDLNLLVTLDALLAERNVTRAGRRLNVSQSTVSDALARLRRMLGDPLLVRVGREMQLTPRAAKLRDELHDTLHSIERMVRDRPAFDPVADEREFSISSSDYVALVLLRLVIAHVSSCAPKLRLHFLPRSEDPRGLLLRNEVDLVIEPTIAIDGSGLGSPILFSDDWQCVVAASNPLTDAGLDVDTFLASPYLTYTLGSSRIPNLADQHLATVGLLPETWVTTENFVLVPFLLQGTSLIALVLRHSLTAFHGAPEVRALVPPIDIPDVIEAMYWNPRDTDDPAHTWLRECIATASATLATPG
ncbi:MAG: LysR family transcriptional regulator [Ilumatobacteraceae bacterium]